MIIVGIDEVGRGCLAGPVVAGAVVLSRPVAGLKDSKRLTARQRQRLAAAIHSQAAAVGLGWVGPALIDELGLTAAVRLAMQRALEQITTAHDAIIIDGSYNFLASNPKSRAVIKADAAIPAVSAASIVAKVARDQYMTDRAADYPEYGFESHVGYGTVRHLAKLKLHGACDLHRRSFKPLRSS